jgi:NAD-dependent dihydropyrimidine dehydrogenase PreA subunit
MTYIICEPCIGVKDRACVDECPVDCIYEGEDQLYIHPEECVDCDACLPACPVSCASRMGAKRAGGCTSFAGAVRSSRWPRRTSSSSS